MREKSRRRDGVRHARMVEHRGREEGEDNQAGTEQDGGDIAAVEIGRVASADDFVHAWMRPLSRLSLGCSGCLRGIFAQWQW